MGNVHAIKNSFDAFIKDYFGARINLATELAVAVSSLSWL